MAQPCFTGYFLDLTPILLSCDYDLDYTWNLIASIFSADFKVLTSRFFGFFLVNVLPLIDHYYTYSLENVFLGIG